MTVLLVSRPRRTTQRLLAASALALLLALAACAPSDGAETPASLPEAAAQYRLPADTPIVLISIDTLRSDRLPIYGHDAIETPAIDALRRDGILYTHAFTHMGLTLPAHLSIFSGLVPLDHGVRDNIGYALEVDAGDLLAGRLGEAGYDTAGFVSTYVLRPGTGAELGFDYWDADIPWLANRQLGTLQRDGRDTLERTVAWLEERDDSAPLFLFFHLYEPHSPYEPAEPWASRYEDRYDAEVAEADASVGGLLDALRERGLYDRSLVILLSDHGEGLMDHGEMEHEILIYREVLQVPLVVKLPDSTFAGSTVDTTAQLIDVAPTIYELLDVEAPGDLPGRSLLTLDAEPDRHVFSESLYPRLHLGWSDLASIIRDRYHLIEGPDPELYDLRQDPAETVNLLPDREDVAAELRALLARYDRSVEAPSSVDDETREALAALGYLSGGSGDVTEERERPDPKSRIHVLSDLSAANRLYLTGRSEEAVAAFRDLLEEEPDMVQAWEELAKALRATGRSGEALEAYETALELSGGSGNVHLSIAELLLSLGELEDAAVHAEAALPAFAAAWDLLAQIALRQDDLKAAREYLDEALATRGSHVGPLITETDWLTRSGRFEEAVAVSERAEREFGEQADREVLRGLYFHRASALLQLGRLEEAEDAYLEEIELSPDELAPYSFLAFLYATEGRPEEAGNTLRRMLETNPTPEAHAQAVQTLRALGDRASAQGLLQHARERWPGHPALAEL